LDGRVQIYRCRRGKCAIPVAAPAVRNQRSVRNSVLKNGGLNGGFDIGFDRRDLFDWSRGGNKRAIDVDEAASFSVGASADSVEGLADFGLVLGMSSHMSKLGPAVRELAFEAVAANAVSSKDLQSSVLYRF